MATQTKYIYFFWGGDICWFLSCHKCIWTLFQQCNAMIRSIAPNHQFCLALDTWGTKWPASLTPGIGHLENCSAMWCKKVKWAALVTFTTHSMGQRQRWKNIQACEQCSCYFFSSSGKIYAKFYVFLTQKWAMSQFVVFFCRHFWRFMGLFENFRALYATFFGLLHCFVENSLILQFTHFLG